MQQVYAWQPDRLWCHLQGGGDKGGGHGTQVCTGQSQLCVLCNAVWTPGRERRHSYHRHGTPHISMSSKVIVKISLR